jgi:hypothetical protein
MADQMQDENGLKGNPRGHPPQVEGVTVLSEGEAVRTVSRWISR